MLRVYGRCDHEYFRSVVCCLFLAFFSWGLQHVKGFEWASNLKLRHWAVCSWDWMSISYSNGPRSVPSEKHDLVDCCVNKETWKTACLLMLLDTRCHTRDSYRIIHWLSQRIRNILVAVIDDWVVQRFKTVQNAAWFMESSGENKANELNPLKTEVDEPK